MAVGAASEVVPLDSALVLDEGDGILTGLNMLPEVLELGVSEVLLPLRANGLTL